MSMTQEKMYMNVDDVCAVLGVSKAFAYKIMKGYNEELKDTPDMQVGIEQTLALERGSRVHDDAPDADEGAIYYLQKNTRQQIYTPKFGKRTNSKNIW